MSYAKKLSICAVCIALCYALPLAFHALALGSLLSPMHLPVLLCGLVCGWPYGLVCGIVGPILSSVLSAMPAASQLVYMVPELCVYGWCAGLLFRHIRTGNSVADLYCALIPAMLAGRVAGGLMRAVFYLAGVQSYSLSLWASAYVVGTLPGIVLQLIVLPVLVLVLMKARLIPPRYPVLRAEAAVVKEP